MLRIQCNKTLNNSAHMYNTCPLLLTRLIIFNNKEHLYLLEGLQNCVARALVHTPMSVFLSCPAVFSEALAPVHSSRVCVPLHFTVFVHALAPVHTLSERRHVDPLCLLHSHSVFKHSFWVASPPPSSLILTICIINYQQCEGCPSSLLHKGSWLGFQDLPTIGAVSSMSWLPIVEAHGCPGHSTSTLQLKKLNW